MKKVFSIILVFALMLTVFTACGNGNTNSGDPIFGDNDSVATPAPTPTPVPLTPEPLTGLKKDSTYPNGKCPVAVMVNNIKMSNGNDAFPQWGIGSADLIYEMVTEGGITRMMAIFADYEHMPKVGPVRSARDQHVQMMLPLDALYVHEGASIFAKRMLGEMGYDENDYSMFPYMAKDLYNSNPVFGTTVVKWDADRRAYRSQEMCAFTDSEMVTEAVENGADGSGEPKPIFNFVPYDKPERSPKQGDAQSMHFQYSSSYYAGFDYNAETGTYYKTNTKGEPHIDGDTDEQLNFKNVLLLTTTIVPYTSMGLDAGMLSHVELGFGGEGYYFTNGKFEQICWMKGAANEPLRIVDYQGNEVDVQINCGKTYIGITDKGMRDYCLLNGNSLNETLATAPIIVENAADNVEATDE